MAGDTAAFAQGIPIAASTDQNEAVVNSASALGSCYSAVIDTIASGLTILDEFSREMLPGQRIFFNIVRGLVTGAAAMTRPASSLQVGDINLSRTFDPRTSLQWSASSASKAVTLRDVINV